MTVTTGRDRTVEVVCAPRYTGVQAVVTVPADLAPVAEKLADAGRRRAALPPASPQRRNPEEALQREKIWAEIRDLWYGEAEKMGLPKAIAMQLLGISRQAFYDIINHRVGIEASQGPSGPPATHGTTHIRAWAQRYGRQVPSVRLWAQEHDHQIPAYGPIPHEVRDAYRVAMEKRAKRHAQTARKRGRREETVDATT